VEKGKAIQSCVDLHNILNILLLVALVVGVSETVSWTYRTHKAGIVPGGSQSVQELVPCLDGEVTAVATGPEHLVVV